MSTPSLTYVPPSSSDRSPNLQTALAFIEACNNWYSNPDGTVAVEQTLDLFDESLQHLVLPKSLQRPALNKNDYTVYFTGMLHLLKGFKATVHEVIESTAGNSVVIHASSVGLGVSGAPYANEYMLVFHMIPSNDPGVLPKILSVKEFVDSKLSVDFFQEERRRAA
ncbi:hypothetical protein BT96DRAFT_852953, partial [Gymnopus androsaceus JB14]